MKKNMFSKLLLGAAMLFMTASFTACVDDNEDKGMPYLELGAVELPFTLEGGEAFFTVSTNRPWSATLGEGSDWIVVDPMEGVGETKVSISVPAATRGRVGTIAFHLANTYDIFETKSVTIYQGEVEAAEVLWHENFGTPEKVDNNWPLIADYTGWEKGGTVGADVTYGAPSGKMSVRAASPISEEYADASGSGKLFFGTGEPSFVAGNIAAAGKTAFTLNFGGAYNNYDTSATTFDPAKFHVYISGDNKKWSTVNYTLAAAGSKWNYATAEFSLKEAADKLYVMLVADEASVFSVDDIQLVSGGAGGTEIDLSQGTENPNVGGGGDEPKPDGPTSTDLPGAGKYMMVWTIDGKTLATIPAETFYMLTKEVSVANNEIAAAGNEAAAWTIEAASTANLFTIKGSDNNYYAMKGEYNSFNKVDQLGDAEYAYNWAFTKNTDGTFKIMNHEKQKWIQYDSQYKNVSASTKDGALPKLYKLNEAGTAYVGVAEGGSTPDPTPTDAVSTTINALIGMMGSTTVTLDKDYYFEAIVLSDVAGGNYTGNNLVLQTEGTTTAKNGVVVFGSQVDPKTLGLARNDKVKVTLLKDKAQLKIYNDLYEVTGGQTDTWCTVEKIGTGSIAPTVVTVDQLKDFQSMLVTVKDATTSAAGTWCTADAPGQHTLKAGGADLTVYVKKGAAAFVDKAFKAATGDITGIVTMYNKNVQLAPRDLNDVTAFADGGSTPDPDPDPNPNPNPNPDPDPSGEGYVEITKIADLAAGDYYIGGFGQSGTLQLFIGKLTSKHGTTVVYNYDSASGELTTESSDKAVIVTFEAVEGQANSYRIKYDGKFLVATLAKSGNLALVDASDAKAAYYWTFEDKDNTGMKALQGGTTEYTAQLVCSSGTDKNILRSGASTTAGNGIRLYKKK